MTETKRSLKADEAIEMSDSGGDFSEVAQLAISIGLAEEVSMKGDGYVLHRNKGEPYNFRSLTAFKAFVLGAAESKQANLEGFDEGASRSRIMNALVHVVAEVMGRFGRYDEIFLTPCLRHIDAMPAEARCDIESYDFIALMTGMGAARVERREGDKHPYSVLVVDRSHPLVRKATDAPYLSHPVS